MFHFFALPPPSFLSLLLYYTFLFLPLFLSFEERVNLLARLYFRMSQSYTMLYPPGYPSLRLTLRNTKFKGVDEPRNFTVSKRWRTFHFCTSLK